MITGPWQPLWLGEDILKRVQEPVKHGGLIAAESVEVLCGLDVMPGGTDAAPENLAALMPECHA